MLGNNLKRLREEQGYTQETLAKASGVGENYISAIERGVRTAGGKTIRRLCDCLMVSELTLRFGEREIPPSPMPLDLQLIEQKLLALDPIELLEVRLLLEKHLAAKRQGLSA